MPAASLIELLNDRPKRWRKYTRAARLVLGIRWRISTGTLRLPRNYFSRLHSIELYLWLGSSAAEAFDLLPDCLEINDVVREFSNQNPSILPRVQVFLRTDYDKLRRRLTSHDAPPQKGALTQQSTPAPQYGPRLGQPAEPIYDPFSIGALFRRQQQSRD
jgi:hypothetical protein